MNSISSINAVALPQTIQPSGGANKASDFGSMLSEAVKQVEQSRTQAGSSVDRFLAGEGEELHTVALQTQRAELEFEMLLQVRNKVVQAYQEIMRMQM
jgi:flagellar hook-basal body complex protein FliE